MKIASAGMKRRSRGGDRGRAGMAGATLASKGAPLGDPPRAAAARAAMTACGDSVMTCICIAARAPAPLPPDIMHARCEVD